MNHILVFIFSITLLEKPPTVNFEFNIVQSSYSVPLLSLILKFFKCGRFKLQRVDKNIFLDPFQPDAFKHLITPKTTKRILITKCLSSIESTCGF